MRFLENLDILLYRNKLTRSDLARAAGLSPSTVNAWFNRSCENVSLKSLVEIAQYFNVTLDDLVNGDLSVNIEFKNENLSKQDVEQLKRLLTYYEEIKRWHNDK